MTDARGKLGGQVFTKTRSGATVRTKVTPKNPKSTSQGRVRTSFGKFATAWNNLTEAQREAWKNAATANPKTNVFGDLYNPTGRSLFIGTNINVSTVNGAQLDSPVSPVEIPDFGYISLTADSSVPEVVFLFYPSNSLTTDQVVVIEATSQENAGFYNFSGKYKYVTQLSNTVAVGSVDVVVDYQEVFGALIPGKKISFRISVIDKSTGQRTARKSQEIIVA